VKNILYLSLNMSLYGYGFEGMGYRYPKRRRRVSVETYIGDDKDQEAWAKAAIFNKAIADENPWIKHLRETGTYAKIRKLLLDAKASYVPKDPEKRSKAMARRMTHIGQELEVLNKDFPKLQKAYKYTTPYGMARSKVMNKLVREANLLNLQYGIELPKGVPQLSLDVLFPGEEGKPFREYYARFLPGAKQ
jgi:hypothetical protein